MQIVKLEIQVIKTSIMALACYLFFGFFILFGGCSALVSKALEEVVFMIY